MDCSKLDVTSYFQLRRTPNEGKYRFLEPSEKSYMRSLNCAEKKYSYSEFSQSNSRKPSTNPLSRDPLTVVGSTVWWADNVERIKLQKALTRIFHVAGVPF